MITCPEFSGPKPAEAPMLRIGKLSVETPVVLAPMAGITNAAFRQLCREQGAGSRAAELRRSERTRLSSTSDDDRGGLSSAIRSERSEQSSRGLYVSEMITSRGIVERDPKTLSMLRF